MYAALALRGNGMLKSAAKNQFQQSIYRIYAVKEAGSLKSKNHYGFLKQLYSILIGLLSKDLLSLCFVRYCRE